MATTSNCFSGILRRLLCGRAHPPDAMAGDSKTDQKSCGTATPGIVARLMGLDSLPEADHSVPRRNTLESILRSRSVNSINYIPVFDLFQTHQQHRRAKTSVSFRELPMFLDEPSYDLFLSCLEGVADRNVMRPGVTKSEMGFLDEKRKAIKTERNRGGVVREKVVKNKNKNKNRADFRKSETVNAARMIRVSSSWRRRLARKEEVKKMMKPRDDSDWFVGFEEVEGICNEFGQKLFDDMLQRVVVELNMDQN